jgi:hypothetical protein
MISRPARNARYYELVDQVPINAVTVHMDSKFPVMRLIGTQRFRLAKLSTLPSAVGFPGKRETLPIAPLGVGP